MKVIARLAVFTFVTSALLTSISSIATPLGGKDRSIGPLTAEPLSDGQVLAAINNAIHGKRHSIGITLNDVQTSIFSAMVCDTCAVSGYTIVVYAPEDYIEYIAIQAHNEMIPFGLADVTPEMRQPVLHVFALPSTANYVDGSGLSMASSVHRVVMTDTRRTDIVQPLETTNGSLEDNSALRSVTYQSAGATFPMSEVVRLRGMDSKGEFFIVVVGDNQNKYFKVKQRYAKMLFH